MASLAPDIPELQHVPQAARSLVYMRALISAIRSPSTLLTGLLVLALATTAGTTQGAAFGTAGAFLGAAAGAVASAFFFFKVLLPWRARRLLPALLAHTDWPVFDEAENAGERITRMINNYKQREARERDSGGGTT